MHLVLVLGDSGLRSLRLRGRKEGQTVTFIIIDIQIPVEVGFPVEVSLIITGLLPVCSSNSRIMHWVK